MKNNLVFRHLTALGILFYYLQINFIEAITCGVLQGSILGSLLLLIFDNDLSKVTKYLEPIMFADDTSLFHSHKNIKTLFQIVNSELKLVNEWFLANGYY